MSRRAGRPGFGDLEERIGHDFANQALLREALTHTSVARPIEGQPYNYQRLEFLGDRVLGLVAADILFHRFPDSKEGELSRRLSELVRRETCAQVADNWGVGPHIIFGLGVPRTVNRANRSILADICESVIGAVYRDGGFDAARRVIETGFAEAFEGAARTQRDPKTALQEWIQARGGQPPIYHLVERTGPEHAPVFLIEVVGEGLQPMRGSGANKRAAEQNAAENALVALGLRKDKSGD
ncbi:MAG: ribonuclease III [Microvirga sp.]|nr:ribonuclease III [Microvirga sp.]